MGMARKIRVFSSEKGFTLTEIAVATAITGFLSLLVVSQMETQSKAIQSIQSTSDFQELFGQIVHATANPNTCSATLGGKTFGNINNFTVNADLAGSSDVTGAHASGAAPASKQMMNIGAGTQVGRLKVTNIALTAVGPAIPMHNLNGSYNQQQAQLVVNVQVTGATSLFGAAQKQSVAIPMVVFTNGGNIVGCQSYNDNRDIANAGGTSGATDQKSACDSFSPANCTNTAPNDQECAWLDCSCNGGATCTLVSQRGSCTNRAPAEQCPINCGDVFWIGKFNYLNPQCNPPGMTPPLPPPPPSCHGCACSGMCGQHFGCFIAGTEVETPNGQVPIEKISVGDIVYSYDTDAQQTVEGEVGTVFVHNDKQYGEVTLNDGTTLSVTPVHRFYLPRTKEWVAIGKLKVGDVLLRGLGENAHEVTIESMDFSHMKRATVYNFHVKKYMNYYVDGVLVHNMKPYLLN